MESLFRTGSCIPEWVDPFRNDFQTVSPIPNVPAVPNRKTYWELKNLFGIGESKPPEGGLRCTPLTPLPEWLLSSEIAPWRSRAPGLHCPLRAPRGRHSRRGVVVVRSRRPHSSKGGGHVVPSCAVVFGGIAAIRRFSRRAAGLEGIDNEEESEAEAPADSVSGGAF
jgi:hypothetical protein